MSNFYFAQDQESDKPRPKVGLVLSGGGAKGFAHVEAIEAIERAGIKIDYISGTSVGAIIGSLYAAGYSPEEIKKAIASVDFMELFLQDKDRNFIPFFDKSYREKYIFSFPFNKFKLSIPFAISKGQGPLMFLTNLLYNVHEVHDFSKLPIPFLCIATNLKTGEEEQMESGFLPLSVLASGAYPSLIEPVKINDKILIDGGIVNNFPAKVLKNKGMDIIIGVDLGTGLQDVEKIKSIFNIITQIISFRINIKTDFERSYVDLLIKPDLKNFTVTDFDKKDSIINRGKIAAEKVFPELVKIAEAQGYIATERPQIESPSEKHLFITKLDINGSSAKDSTYIKRKTNISIPQNSSITKLDKGISALYSTGNFNQVYYKLENDQNNESQHITLYLDKKDNNSLKFGIHYDDVYKSSLLTNITLNKLFLNNSTFSLDVIFGTNFRTYLNYFIDNGVFPSIGVNTTFNAFNFDYSDLKRSEYSFNRIRNFNQQIYFQSTLIEKYAFGLGMEYSYISMSPFMPSSILRNIDFKKHENSFFNPYFYIQADTQDDAFFPTKGFKLDATAKYVLLSNADTEDLEPFTIIKGDLSYSIPIGKRFSIETQGFLGISFNTPSLQYKYFLGGYFEQDFYNFKKFLGLPYAFISGNHLFSLYPSLNYKVFKNHFLKVYANFANIEDEFENLQYFKYKYSSYGIGYGYNSPFGPINLFYTHSVNDDKKILSVSLGYWF
ncbi:MAG: patatin-like phospholipase family protein [Flavobacteriaceae bacterium]|nr:patatin-like phospholipase family protein [Flavobacteriaceae bacterium]